MVALPCHGVAGGAFSPAAPGRQLPCCSYSSQSVQTSLPSFAALVRCLQGGGSAVQHAYAASALVDIYERSPASQQDAVAAEVAAADGVPALLQLMASHDSSHPGAADAGSLLCDMASNSSERCQAIRAAGGVAILVRCFLESSSEPVAQANAAGALANMAGRAREAIAAAVTATALPAAIRSLGSRNALVAGRAATLLANIASRPGGRQSAAAAGAIPALVRLLRHPSRDVVAASTTALNNITVDDAGNSRHIGALLEAGGIPPLVDLLASSTDPRAFEPAADLLKDMLYLSHGSPANQVIEAGGVPAFGRCLEDRRLSVAARAHVAGCLRALAARGAQPSRQIAEAGGIRTLVGALAEPCSPRQV